MPLYETAADWHAAPHRRVALFGMSGLGKTYISDMLRRSRGWFHYSVDYRIGTRYMGEHIVDHFKREAMKNTVLADMLRRDAIYIASNISFANLSPLSSYLGKPGDHARGGIPFEEYRRRQAQHREAEIAALLDAPRFVKKAGEIYGYPNFVCDTGGSICEVVDASNPDNPVMTALSDAMLPVWIKGDAAHADELARRFDADPKPMYYRPQDLEANRLAYLAEIGCTENDIDPDAFIRWCFRRLLGERQSRYAAMAEWGVTVDASDIAAVRSAAEFEALIASALP